MGEKLGELVGYERVSSNGSSDGIVYLKPLGSYVGSERIFSGGSSGGWIFVKLDEYPLGVFSDGILGGEVEGYSLE